ncbi:MAG: hypothetical protein K2O18_09655 [Oscillospiraceae bacterium]|nr:hypothetical protein [Oscillospiraceae bacterium]
MKTVLITGAALLVGAAIGFLINLRTIVILRRRIRALKADQGKTHSETMKRVVWACVGNGFAWVWFSYILAALDKAQIAEDLSKVALAEIIVPVAVYAIKSVVENLSKNNRWPDKTAATDTNSATGPEGKLPPDMDL